MKVQQQMEFLVTNTETVSQSIRMLDDSRQFVFQAMVQSGAVAEQTAASSDEIASQNKEQYLIHKQLIHLSENLERFVSSLVALLFVDCE
ncbi:hypothetical protein [Cohnella silvisoli]|uniref:DUF1657 domain-containing protein n=1 Tax=Cohnella silvisoli TaxID=2873699 RepID=A0ABV1KMF6_9BACL|nr:hypothetical protein [Cohnella silvisoli]MCD9020666.1 hypothetical protein [Cohnella silvisoli]